MIHVFMSAVVDPFEHHGAARGVDRPEVTLTCAGLSSVDVFDEGFVDLKILVVS